MAENDTKAAFASVIAPAVAAAAADGSGEQLDMLMPPTRADLTSGETERIDAAIKQDRRGRPKGAQNVATREMLDFVRRTMGDPLMRRFQYAMHTPESLAIVLGCNKLEAFDRLDKMWSELARFFYAQKAPTDADGNAVAPRLTVLLGGQTAAPIGPDGHHMPPWLYMEAEPQPHAQTQQNQALLSSPDRPSHGEPSHGSD